MAGKWVELLKEIAPHVNRVALLLNPATAPFAELYLNPFKSAAAALGVEVIPRVFMTRPNWDPSLPCTRVSRLVA